MSRSMCFSLNGFVVVLATAVMLAAGSSRRRMNIQLKNSNKCNKPVTTSPYACRAAMAIVDEIQNGRQAGDTFHGVIDESTLPTGCIYCKGSNCAPKPTGTHFNTNSADPEVPGVKQYCGKGLDASLRGTSVLFLGDSDTDYWTGQRTNFVDSHNIGVGGYSCKDVHDEIKAGGRQNNILKKTFGKPNTLVLTCGETDIANGISARKTFRTLVKIVKKATKFGKVNRVIYLGTKPEPDATMLYKRYRRYDAMVKQFAVDHAANPPAGRPVSFTMIDVYSAFEALGNPKTLWKGDGLHLTSEGYDLLTTWTQTALADTAGGCLVMQGGTCTNSTPARRLLDVMV